ncbi:MAG TPA: GTP cyclohydrolase I FolE [Burkholderiales bacterium]|nr:GTP cyclohydrolase I FolE [Burkholderiales bacterium]
MDHADLETALADPIAPHVEAIMAHLGEDVRRPGLVQTPRRFAAAMRYLAGGYEADPAMVVGSGVFEAEGQGLVLVRDVEFFSLCEHHLLPFFGRIHVAYLPDRKIIGLSKIPRIVDLYARRFQVQERLTEQVAEALVEVLGPRGVMVMAEAQHMCMAMRGVQKQHSATATRALRGLFAHDRHARQEVLAMLHNPGPGG